MPNMHFQTNFVTMMKVVESITKNHINLTI